MIQIKDLNKIYADGTHALVNINLALEQGIFGLIGPNGAGKTTLMRIIATLLRPSSGEITIWGHNPQTSNGGKAIRRLLGYLPQTTGFQPQLTVENNLDYFALLKGIRDKSQRRFEIDKMIDRTGLQEVRTRPAHTLSGGTRRRLGIAITLLNDPLLIIVDEPTAGLDPAERIHFRTVLHELAGDRLVILSSHIIEDIQQMSSTIAIIHHGQLRFCGSSAELIRRAEGYVWVVPDQSNVSDPIPMHLLGTGMDHKQRIIAPQSPTQDAYSVTPSLEDAYMFMMVFDSLNTSRQQ